MNPMTFEKVRGMIADQLQVDASTITENSRLVEDLRADSANVMVMILELETEFGIEVEDEVILNLKTVGDVVKYIDSHQG
ncbi:MAG: acyl carrier protein [Clostridia bacterium]|nr:acyl carrier protein [Clostridia bacterium]MBQ7849529.1 acyl carrier protein [Clostridia bacterium]